MQRTPPFRELEGSLQGQDAIYRRLTMAICFGRHVSQLAATPRVRQQGCHVSARWRVLICNISGGADGYGGDDGDFSCHHSVDVVILGAGYAGLGRPAPPRRKCGLRIALVSDYDQFLERVRLQESIVADVPPRIPSISAFVAGTAIEFIRGHVTSLAADQRRIRVATDKQQREVAFDQAIYALGSSIDVDGVRGAAALAYRPSLGTVRGRGKLSV
jgi:hypothetical protein